jgi:hypothetical protein
MALIQRLFIKLLPEATEKVRRQTPARGETPVDRRDFVGT